MERGNATTIASGFEISCAALCSLHRSERFIALRAVRRMALKPLQQAPMLSSAGTCPRLHLPELFVA